ncbi:MAG: DUF4390 domain-containing protein, partial [Burkholderiaceae bacterium]|nr:DUF4390 domain-containing protein [Burkholderiaceae bacterium]
MAFWLVCALMLFGAQSVRAQPNPVDIAQLRASRAEDGLFLTAQIRLELPSIVEDALQKGVAVFFVAEAELLRD